MHRWLYSLTLLGAAAAAIFFGSQSAAAQGLDIGGGYSYLHSNVPAGGCGCFSMNGGYGWIGFSVTQHVAIVGEVAAQHTGNVAGTNGDLNLVSFMAGPRFTLYRTGRLHPFGQVLVGGVHASGAEAPGTNGLVGSPNGFAAAVGGGLNFSLTTHWSLRLIQADYFVTHLDNGVNDHQNNLRIGAGISFRFGAR